MTIYDPDNSLLAWQAELAQGVDSRTDGISLTGILDEMDLDRRTPNFGGFVVIALWRGEQIILTDTELSQFYWDKSSDPDGAFSPDRAVNYLLIKREDAK